MKKIRVTLTEPGHFVGADDCKFFRHDHVGRWCVSTIGDYYPRGEKFPRSNLGYHMGPDGTMAPAYFETAVFDLKAKTHRWREIICVRTKDEDAALRAHEAAVEVRTAIVKLNRAEKRGKKAARETLCPPKARVGVFLRKKKGAKRGDRR